jgi:hypothetical protein
VRFIYRDGGDGRNDQGAVFNLEKFDLSLTWMGKEEKSTLQNDYINLKYTTSITYVLDYSAIYASILRRLLDGAVAGSVRVYPC